MGGTRTTIKNMKQAQKQGMAPDWNAIAELVYGGADPEAEFEGNGGIFERTQTAGYSDDLLNDQLQELNKGKKYGGIFKAKDSAEYTRVKSALEQIVNGLEPFTEDEGNNEKILRNVSLKYMNLVNACQIYLKKDKGITRTGKGRRDRITMILELARRDLGGIQEIIFNKKYLEPGALSQLNWKDILRDARYETMRVDNLMAKDTFGSGAKKGANAGRVLKEQGLFYVPETLSKEKVLQNNAWTEFYDRAEDTPEGMSRWGLRRKNKIRHSDRNVATSRLANLLGLGSIVENTKKVRVQDELTGNVHRGIVMTKAKGSGSDKVAEEVSAVTKKMRNINERHAWATKDIGYSVQKDMTSLQVFDYICGQADRNAGNIFLEQNADGKYIGVHAIDNDMSFMGGVNMENVYRKQGAAAMGRGRLVVDDSENLTIPHMDKQLAQNILDLPTDEVRFALQDLIEPEFIDSLIQRLVRLKHAIQKEMTKQAEGDSRVFVQDGGWDSQTHMDLMAQSIAFKEFQNRLQAEGKRPDDDSYFEEVSGFGEISDRNYELMKNDTYYARLIYYSMGYRPSSSSKDKYVYEKDK